MNNSDKQFARILGILGIIPLFCLTIYSLCYILIAWLTAFGK